MRLILTEQVFPLQDSTSKLLSVAVSSKSFHDMICLAVLYMFVIKNLMFVLITESFEQCH